MSKGFIILGNQLFNYSYFENHKNCIFFMAEDYELCSFEKHHKHKIIFFLSAMRSFRDEMKEKKLNIVYRECSQEGFKIKYEKKLEDFIKNYNISHLSLFEIEDKFFEKKILEFLKKSQIKFDYLQSPMFLCSRNDFSDYLSTTKKPFMANFYKRQRLKHNILVDEDGKPSFGKWSFDNENRKKIPKDLIIPKITKYKKTSHTSDLSEFVNKNFSNNIGSSNDFWFGTTRKCAQESLNSFIKIKLNLFGDYEDAVQQENHILFHSALSPFINLGLITPGEILKKIKGNENDFKINSYEGYVRQIIGWREFMRGIYQNYYKKLSQSNFFNHEREMKSSWYEGSTGLEPLDYSIKNAVKYGWSHHIERLMILSNIMNLCEIKPPNVYRWFMEMYIDSSDWVMSPNVYGMGLFSDGGIFSTKPYICGSSYFMKMMDFKKGNWCQVMDGLYWRFIDRNRDFFKGNPRLSMMVSVLDKMKTDRKKEIFLAAENFINANTE